MPTNTAPALVTSTGKAHRVIEVRETIANAYVPGDDAERRGAYGAKARTACGRTYAGTVYPAGVEVTCPKCQAAEAPVEVEVVAAPTAAALDFVDQVLAAHPAVARRVARAEARAAHDEAATRREVERAAEVAAASTAAAGPLVAPSGATHHAGLFGDDRTRCGVAADRGRGWWIAPAGTYVSCRSCQRYGAATPAPVETVEVEVEAPAACSPAYYTTPRRPAPVADPAELELEAAARRRQLDAAIVEDMLTGDVEPYADDDRAEHGRGRYAGPLPVCPEASCRATGKRCKRPSGHDATQWHARREDALARLCRCEVCLAWLARRGQQLDDYRAEAPVQLVGTLSQLARHGKVTPMNDAHALVRVDGVLLAAEILPAAPLPARQLAIMPLSADEDGAQLDLFEAVAELEPAGGAR